MAEAEPQRDSAWKKRVTCRYFLHGVCREGSCCRYAHDMTTSNPQTVCKYYLRGACSYGGQCRFDHIKPNQPNENAQRGQINSHIKPSQSHSYSTVKSKLVALKKGDNPLNFAAQIKSPQADDWIKAKEFVPGRVCHGKGPTSYSGAAVTGLHLPTATEQKCSAQAEISVTGDQSLVCPYLAKGICPYGDKCTYSHGLPCDLCGQYVLHRDDPQQNSAHKEECIKLHQADMEEAFAIQRSSNKVCGICMDVVFEKNPPSERRFGILEKCNHIFCLSCIRKWRSAKQFERKIIRACPECRVNSDFVTPSTYWVDDQEEKTKIISEYKEVLSGKACKYFKEGKGDCPFNDKCFYRHANPDGTLANPKPKQVRRRRQNASHDTDLFENILLWQFLDEELDRLDVHLLLDDYIMHGLLLDSDDDSDTDSDSF